MRACLLFTVGCAFACGCAEAPQGPALVPLQGTVTYKGKPLAGIELVFHPENKEPGWMPVAKTSEDGAFSASTRDPGDGAPAGRYRVTAVWRPVVDENGEGPNKLPGRYSNPAKTPLEIEAPSTETSPITLTLTD